MADDLLDISHKALEDAKGVIRNLQDMAELSDVNQILRTNALQAAQDVLSGVTKLNESHEIRDASKLAGLLATIDLMGDFSVLEARAAQELGTTQALVDRIQSPRIDKDQVKQTLTDLEAEIGRMHSEAVRKGIAVLATIARVAIPLL